jgi:hypothetical protein
VPYGPSLRPIKRASKADLKSSLQSGGRTLQRRKYIDSVQTTFLLDKTFVDILVVVGGINLHV